MEFLCSYYMLLSQVCCAVLICAFFQVISICTLYTRDLTDTIVYTKAVLPCSISTSAEPRRNVQNEWRRWQLKTSEAAVGHASHRDCTRKQRAMQEDSAPRHVSVRADVQKHRAEEAPENSTIPWASERCSQRKQRAEETLEEVQIGYEDVGKLEKKRELMKVLLFSSPR